MRRLFNSCCLDAARKLITADFFKNYRRSCCTVQKLYKNSLLLTKNASNTFLRAKIIVVHCRFFRLKLLSPRLPKLLHSTIFSFIHFWYPQSYRWVLRKLFSPADVTIWTTVFGSNFLAWCWRRKIRFRYKSNVPVS